MTAFYNEIDPFAADWIRNLIDRGLVAPGVVDTRSITELDPNELKQYTQVHLFAGLSGWSLALRLAGWPDDQPVWTGSCPCQPFSSAGKQKGHADERHLWPEMYRLVRECRVDTIFGEQVSSAIGHGWLDGVFGDLEGAGYACGASVLGAFSVGAPHKRSRLYWVADAELNGGPRRVAIEPTEGDGASGERAPVEPRRCGDAHALGDSVITRLEGHGGLGQEPGPQGREDSQRHGAEAGAVGAWSDFAIVHCTDGKARRVGCGVFPLVAGLPRDMGRGQPELFRLARRARGNRTGRLKGYGNAIVPQVAAAFVLAHKEQP